jgi:hypothetical protein
VVASLSTTGYSVITGAREPRHHTAPTAMTSQQVKQAFAAAGIRVRVADQGLKFRVCTVNGASFDREVASAVAASVGLTDVLANLGGQYNQAHELIGYKPGAIVRA